MTTRPRRIRVTDEQRERAALAAGWGLSDRQVGLLVGMSEASLRRHLRDELDAGRARASEAVVRSLFENAIGGNVVAQIYWTKCRLHWREVAAVEMSGPNGAPLAIAGGVLLVPSGIDAQTWESTVSREQAALRGAEHADALAAAKADEALPAPTRKSRRAPPAEPAPIVVGSSPTNVPVAPKPRYGTFEMGE